MIIYKIINTVNGKIYIGQTIRTLEERKKQHFRDAFINISSCAIHRAMRKYGKDKFIFETLYLCLSKKDMDRKEKEMISKLNSVRPNGYNLTAGGEGLYGYKHTDAAKAKVSKANKGRKMSADEIEARKKTHPHRKLTEEEKQRLISYSLGRKMTEEQKKKMSRLGKKHSEETKAKMKEARKGRKPCLGKTLSLETRQKISEANKGKQTFLGKKHTLETRAKMSMSQKGNKNSLGYKHSEETKRKMSASHKGKKFTEEHKANMRAAQLARMAF